MRLTHQSGNPAGGVSLEFRSSVHNDVQEIETGEDGYALYNFAATSGTSQLTILVGLVLL